MLFAIFIVSRKKTKLFLSLNLHHALLVIITTKPIKNRESICGTL